LSGRRRIAQDEAGKREVFAVPLAGSIAVDSDRFIARPASQHFPASSRY